MPPSLDESVKDRVRKLWFSGETRKNIATECGIGAGTVTNIISGWSQGLDSADYESIREVAVELKKEGLTFTELASIFRRHKYIENLGAKEEQIESLIGNLLDGTGSLPQEKFVESINQLYEISKSENIPPTEVPAYINRKSEEKKRIEDEIQKSRAILDHENIDIKTLEDSKKLKDELKKYGLSTETPHKLVSILQSFKEMGYDPQKIVTNYAHIKSLRETVRGLTKECRIWESRAKRYGQVLPLCQRITRLGIGIEELMIYHSAVIKRADEDGIPIGAAPYRVMMDIDHYNRLGGLKKELANTVMNLQMVNLIAARQHTVGNILMRLLSFGITEDQILNACRAIEVNSRNLNGTPSKNSRTYPIF